MLYLFSYGTLRYSHVQQDLYGRELAMQEDAISGYAMSQVEITDPAVLASSGEKFHPIIRHTGNLEDVVNGVVVELTDAELIKSDSYEVNDYKRVSVTTNSGTQAWVYAAAEARTK